MTNKTIPCVGFLLLKDGKMLVEKRKSTKKIDPEKVCIPSGGIKSSDKSTQYAVIREVKEEFGVDAINVSFIGSLVYPTKECDFLIYYCLVERWQGKIRNLEAQSIDWAPLDEKAVDVWPDKLIIKAIKFRNRV